MMENAVLVSLKGNTAQRDLGSSFILKAGFFSIKWINLAPSTSKRLGALWQGGQILSSLSSSV